MSVNHRKKDRPKRQVTKNHRQYEPDDLDKKILVVLRDEGRASFADIGRRVNLSQPTVHERVNRLREAGYIQGFRARLDYELLGFPLMTYVELRVQQAKVSREELVNRLREMPEVDRMVWVTGDFDALLRVRARNTQQLQDILFKTLKAGEESITSRTTITLSVAFDKAGTGFENLHDQQGG